MRYVTVRGDLAVSLHAERVPGAFALEADAEPFEPYTRLLVVGPSGLCRLEALSPNDIADRVSARWSEVRAERNALLAASDWTQLADAPLSSQSKEQWQAYRQGLRDITAQSDPFDLTWPQAPDSE